MADEAGNSTPKAKGDVPAMDPALKAAISQGVTLSPTTTTEPISGTTLMTSELVIKQVEKFPKENLNHVETEVKTVLPDKEDIQAESRHNEFKSSIENFEKEKLAHTETVEKISIPTAEEIDQEKKATTQTEAT